MSFLKSLLFPETYIPHGHCYLWKSNLVWLHVLSDALIAFAYYSIPIMLVYLARKRDDVPFKGVFLLFGTFITSCGTTHLMEIWTLWHPAYWLSGIIKAITALVSLYTALILMDVVPQALALPRLNQQLSAEIEHCKQVEDELRRSEALLRTINDIPPLGILVLSRQTSQILFFNREFCNIWQLKQLEQNMSQGKITSKQVLTECVDRIAVDRIALEVFVTTATSRNIDDDTKIVEDEIPLLDGRILRRLFGPIQDGDETFAYLYIFEDISQRKQAEQELKQARKAAEAANLAKSTFLANMSHELRSPLNAVLGFTHLLRRSSLTSEQHDYVEIIYRSGEHLLQLINNVLDISKIEAGQMTLNETRFDLYRLLDELVEIFRVEAQQKEVQLCFQRESQLPQFVCCDHLKLRQILINLLSNAVKFTPQGGITLKAKCAELSAEHFPAGVTAEGGHPQAQPDTLPDVPSGRGRGPAFKAGERMTLQFSVQDSGIGIAPDKLNSLFKPFVQVHSGTVTQEGTGLGLAISRKYAQLMGGEIAVSSTAGQGSLFYFEVKATPVSAIAPEPEWLNRRILTLASNQPRYRLLVVDDSPINRQLLVQLLASVGFEIREATNGQEAIEVWEQWEPHLICMDLRMPVMDGYEATQRIKACAKGQQTVIIALTASAFEEDKAIALAHGCDDFVRKPIHEAEIFGTLGRHLGVEYLYESVSESAHQTVSDSGLPLAALAQMPQPWLAKLEEAILDLDEATLYVLIEQMPVQSIQNAVQAELAKALKQCLKNFEFRKILQIVQSNKALVQDA